MHNTEKCELMTMHFLILSIDVNVGPTPRMVIISDSSNHSNRIVEILMGNQELRHLIKAW